MKTLIRILLLIAFLSMTAFAQDPKLNKLLVDNRVLLIQEQLAKAQVRLTVMIELLYLSNNKLDVENSRLRIERNNQAFQRFGYPELARELPPDLKEYEVPLKEDDETD